MSLSNFIDSKGFIGHKDANGDLVDFMDSCQRTMSYELCRENIFYSEFAEKLELLYHNHKFYRYWIGDTVAGRSGCSRDQLKPLIWAAALNRQHYPATNLIKNKFRAYNKTSIDPLDTKPRKPDIVPPWVVYGAIIRSRRCRRFGDYTFLHIFDFIDLFNTLFLCIKSWVKPNETSSDLNQLNEHVFKYRTVQTPVSILSRYLYSKLRRTPNNTFNPWPDHKIYKVLLTYYHNPNTMPPMYQVYKPWINKLL